MKMLVVSFVLGIIHILFGMGLRMVADLRAGLVQDAILDQLVWIVFLTALAPLGYTGILGGELPAGVMTAATYGALAMAVVIFFTGGRRKRSLVMKGLAGLLKYYSVIGYFGDVLSYARLLALGLATSAIALAVNDVARMVTGLPWYTGYVAMITVLIGGHLFNLAVNTLGAFVHSGRLQYLEFFSKFFAGGGKEFRPYRSERRYSVLKDAD
jgi:V/A-type H+-transporting ATPase subunit I